MTESKKTGIKYFQADITLYEDEKFVVAQHIVDPDLKNPELRYAVPHVAIRMLALIYKEGYYMVWDNKVAITVSAMPGIIGFISLNNLKLLINSLIECEFFSKELFNKYNILTSNGIQKRWLHIVKNIGRSNRLVKKEYELVAEKTQKVAEKTQKVAEKTQKVAEKTLPLIESNILVNNTDNNTDNIDNNTNKEKEKNKSRGETAESRGETAESRGETAESRGETAESRGETAESRGETAESRGETKKKVKTNWKEKGKIEFGPTDYQMLNGMSEDFKDAWLDWLNYLSFEHHKELKTLFVRQPALEKLVSLANMDELVAIKIIRESISSGWKQFYKLKEEKINENGKQNSNNNGKGHQPFSFDKAIRDIDDLLGPHER